MNWMTVEKKSQSAEKLIYVIGDSHSFIRECYILSPSYIESQGLGTVAPDCLPCGKVLVSIPSEECPGVELLFGEISEFNIFFDGDFEPKINFVDRKIETSFGLDFNPIVSKTLFYRLLDTETFGNTLRYGKNDINNEYDHLIF